MATQAKPDYYQVLGIDRTATDQEIKVAFQRLVTEFHTAGKPKTIDDVEWLRTVTRAYRVLGDNELRPHYDRTDDDSNLVSTKTHGYDEAFLQQLEQNVDNQIVRQRSYWLAHGLFDFLNI